MPIHTQHNRGFIGLMFLILIGAVATLYFLKDEHGVRYIYMFKKQKEQVMKEVEQYKEMMKKHDREIEKNL